MDKIIDPQIKPGRKVRQRRQLLLLFAVALLICVFSVSLISYRHTITPDGIIIHHSAVTTMRDSGLPIDVNMINLLHKDRGFGIFYWGRTYYVGYHYVILPDGTVQTGRPEHCEGAHAEGHNSSIGICLIGDFDTSDNPDGAQGPLEPTEAQLRSLTELCQQLRTRYQIPLDKVFRHSDVNPNTHCPGDRFPFSRMMQTF